VVVVEIMDMAEPISATAVVGSPSRVVVVPSDVTVEAGVVVTVVDTNVSVVV
jgi:hypothetical protein